MPDFFRWSLFLGSLVVLTACQTSDSSWVATGEPILVPDEGEERTIAVDLSAYLAGVLREESDTSAILMVEARPAVLEGTTSTADIRMRLTELGAPLRRSVETDFGPSFGGGIISLAFDASGHDGACTREFRLELQPLRRLNGTAGVVWNVEAIIAPRPTGLVETDLVVALDRTEVSPDR